MTSAWLIEQRARDQAAPWYCAGFGTDGNLRWSVDIRDALPFLQHETAVRISRADTLERGRAVVGMAEAMEGWYADIC